MWRARSSPETFILASLIGTTAAWATRTGTLPGWTLHGLGAAVQAALWMSLYAALALPYLEAAATIGKSARGTLWRLGVSLLAALLITFICKFLLAGLLAPSPWSEFFYLRFLLPPALVALCCTILLPAVTRALFSRIGGSPAALPLPQLLPLLAASMVLVSAADLAFQWRGGSSVEMRLHSDVIMINSWATNVLILFSAHALVFAVTSKVAAALAIVSPLYLALGLATLAKIEHMHSAVQPLDLIRLAEFAPLFRSFFGTGGLIAATCGIALWGAAIFAASRSRPTYLCPVRRAWVGVTSSALLVGLVFGLVVAPSSPKINALLMRVGAPEGQHREKARRNGFLLSFLSELPTLLVGTPPNYTPTAVASAVSRYPGSSDRTPMHPRINLILYVVESLMDPADLGFHYTSDPIPNLRALKKDYISGHAIVPEEFGGSANTEFELLTGMTRSFLPEQSLPYRQYLKRSIPSLPRALKDLGYTTSAIQADPKYYYDRERVYDLLNFQHKIWLRGLPGIQPGVRGLAPQDEVVTDAIVEESHGPTPYFIFAFPSSTHSPYNVGVYRQSDLDIVGFESSDDLVEVKEYINALREADRAIGKLVDNFRHRPDPTIIAILGDHLPPLPQRSLNIFFGTLRGTSLAERLRRLHRVPLVVWANFPIAKQQVELSTNALASFLLAQMGIRSTGFFALTDSVRRTFPVVGRYLQGADGRIWSGDSLPPRERTLWADYRLVQYDLLLGKQHSLRTGIPGWTDMLVR